MPWRELWITMTLLCALPIAAFTLLILIVVALDLIGSRRTHYDEYRLRRGRNL